MASKYCMHSFLINKSTIIHYLRCYIVWSELGCHQVTLVYLGKSKVTQFNWSILKQAAGGFDLESFLFECLLL